MTYNESTQKASAKYKKTHIKRVPLDMQIEKYERVKGICDKTNTPVNTWIKSAIDEKLERESDNA